MDAKRLSDDLERELAAGGDPARAEQERRYLKSDLRFLGASVPVVRTAVKRLHREHPAPDRNDVVALAAALWEAPVHERRLAAVEWLDLCRELLTPADLPLLERLLREARTWALVDGLAARVVGAVRERYPENLEETLEAWSTDSDPWMRRASLLAYLVALRTGDGDFAAFARKADRMLCDREPFVQKAIGWVLRDTGKRRPRLVAGWLEPRAHLLAGLSIREAVKYLPAGDRDRILRAGGR
ncbi:MAG TPA: DNA alkylation repair protein [Egibacteraceae bacterium]|nr:DNA alkylation repair protein [Egibacteraceae bacterium]